jgi:Putative binding domain, N-terminal/Domain of unknown function (DUF4214)
MLRLYPLRFIVLCGIALFFAPVCTRAQSEETYFIDVSATLSPSGSGKAQAQTFTVSTTTTFVLRFASDFNAEAAVMTGASAQSFVNDGSYSFFGRNFVNAFGTATITLGPGSYAVGMRNRSTSSNRSRLELDYALSVPGWSYYDSPYSRAETIAANSLAWRGFTIQSGVRYFIDGCNSGLDTYIIPENQLTNFQNHQAFQYYYGGDDDSAFPGLWELKLNPGTYYLVFRNRSNNGKTVTYVLDRYSNGTPPPNPTPTPTPIPTPMPTPTPLVCHWNLNPSSTTVSAGPVPPQVVFVNAERGCRFTSASNASWLTITSSAGTDAEPGGPFSGSVSYSVANNPNSSTRTGTINIADKIFTVTQLGATPSPTPTPAPSPNPIDGVSFFVQQQYLDFLNRQPDPSGMNFWSSHLASCGANQACIEATRVNVSAAFYLSIEFQQTGFLIERVYRAAFGNATGNSTLGGAHQLSVPIVRFNELITDMQKIGQNVVVLQPGWEAALENNKQVYVQQFVLLQRFLTAFPGSMTAAQFVDKLNANAGNPLSQAERNQLVTDLSSNTKSRAQVLRVISEHQNVVNAEFNRAFVLIQYFGYLRRNPNDAPDADYTGYEFWLNKLNQFKGDYQTAEMVRAFIIALEYRKRFGP